MKKLLIFTVSLMMSLSAGIAQAQQKDAIGRQIRALAWVEGPATTATVGDATFTIPMGYMFLAGPDTAKFMALTENPTPPVTENLIAPRDLSWFAILKYSADGYVRDDEPIDAPSLLQSITDGTEAGNAERRKNGWTELHVTGWRREPHFDEVTKRLEWALDASAGSEVTTNFQTRILGRYGVTAATLVTDPQHLETDAAAFEKAIAGYAFATGGDYASYEQGDRVAEYGLAALVAGGAAAVAAKTGLLAKFGKLIAVGGFALVAGIVGFFKKLFRRKAV